jgi:hypothetical protein
MFKNRVATTLSDGLKERINFCFNFACYHCNAHKGPNLSGLDPESGTLVRLFHPRQDRWDEHFERNGVLIVGLSAVGDECRRSAPASRRVAFLRGKDTEDPNLLFRFSFWRCQSVVSSL